MLPTGAVTFLFTDIEGSTPLWESQPQQMAEALQIHNSALRQAIEDHIGVVFKTVVDAFPINLGRWNTWGNLPWRRPVRRKAGA